jgi:heme-degrading monooxygenase HmoA
MVRRYKIARRTAMSFAVVGRVELPEGGTIEEGRKQLANDVIPALKQAPGFVSAMFLSPKTGREGLSVIVWNTEEDANNAVKNAQFPAGITPLSFEVREVAASV